MTPAPFWILLLIGVLIAYPIAWRTGYRAGERAELVEAGDDWDEHVDQALTVANEQLTTLSPSELARAIEFHPSNIRYLRDRRDKIT